MSTVIWPDSTKQVIDSIRGAIGRDVEFFVVASSIACGVCSLDSITGHSTDSFCPICSGIYWIPVYSGCVVSGHISWAGADFQNWYSGGYQFDGDVRVQIEFTIANLDIVDRSVYVHVDNKVMEIKNFILRGVQSINRILIDMIEKEKST
jgi:hypothetical protein